MNNKKKKTTIKKYKICDNILIEPKITTFPKKILKKVLTKREKRSNIGEPSERRGHRKAVSEKTLKKDKKVVDKRAKR